MELTESLFSIDTAIRVALAHVSGPGKIGKSILQPTVGVAIANSGFIVDLEDRKGILPAGLPVWRSKDTGAIEETRSRRLIDLVVYDRDGKLVALVETESDLNDLRLSGTTRRNGHYDVFSIARAANGQFFNSYKSLERMAAAAFFTSANADRSLAPSELVERLEQLSTNRPEAHNPLGIGIFLITGRCRPIDLEILNQRVASLSARVISPVAA